MIGTTTWLPVHEGSGDPHVPSLLLMTMTTSWSPVTHEVRLLGMIMIMTVIVIVMILMVMMLMLMQYC